MSTKDNKKVTDQKAEETRGDN